MWATLSSLASARSWYSSVPSSEPTWSIIGASPSNSASRLPSMQVNLAMTAIWLMGPERSRGRCGAPSLVRSEAEPVGHGAHQLVDRDPHLLGGVAVAHGDGAVVERIEVDGDGERRADLVLTSIPLADVLGLVVVDHVPVREQRSDLVGERGERVLLRQRQHGHLVWCETRVQAQHGALLVVDHVLVVGGEQEGGHGAGCTGSRFDHVGHVPLV